MEETPDIKIYKASRTLQAKVGTGTVAPETIAACQKTIVENQTDFMPVAGKFLDELSAEITRARTGSENMEALRQNLTRLVMQLKANGAMFGYPLVGELANTMMHFMESVSHVDKDIIAILEANHKTLSVIVRTGMKGDGGPQGAALKAELQGVCTRYLERQKSG
ncbi:MAG: hypothetical protein H6862_07680 [Rhodospirillales bacterium]|nr:hypothetical protein [Rhodospirillales bacterium]